MHSPVMKAGTAVFATFERVLLIILKFFLKIGVLKSCTISDWTTMNEHVKCHHLLKSVIWASIQNTQKWQKTFKKYSNTFFEHLKYSNFLSKILK